MSVEGEPSGLDHHSDESVLLLHVGAAAERAAQQQLLLLDQAVEEVLLAVVVVDLEEGQHGDAQPRQPGGPQAKLHNRENKKMRSKSNQMKIWTKQEIANIKQVQMMDQIIYAYY